jgi:hypothetical protein
VRATPTLPRRIFPPRLNRLKVTLYRAARAAVPRLSAFPRSLSGGGTTAAAAAPLPATPFASLEEDAAAPWAAAAVAAAPPRAGGAAVDAEGGAASSSGGAGGAPGLGRSLERTLSDIEAAARRPGGAAAPPADAAVAAAAVRRDAELAERRGYLKNFWYAAGERAAGRRR